MSFIIPLILLVISIIGYSWTKKNNKLNENKVSLIGILLFSGIIIFQCIIVIPAGTVGVVDIFGNVSDNTLKPGINFVLPYANVHQFDQKTQNLTEEMQVPSSEGLDIKIDISLLFRIDELKANQIYKTVGINYVDKVVIPKFRSIVRNVTAKYEAKALYTSSRDELSKLIMEGLDKEISNRGIIVESAELRKIELPINLKKSIEEKLKFEQESQAMKFKLDKELQEAERKRIEAQGISDFQKIVSQGISDQLLRWKGIEATEKLANSQNAKIVVIGSGKDGLPLILNNN